VDALHNEGEKTFVAVAAVNDLDLVDGDHFAPPIFHQEDGCVFHVKTSLIEKSFPDPCDRTCPVGPPTSRKPECRGLPREVAGGPNIREFVGLQDQKPEPPT